MINKEALLNMLELRIKLTTEKIVQANKKSEELSNQIELYINLINEINIGKYDNE